MRNKFIFNLKNKDDFFRKIVFFSEEYIHFCLLDSNSSENNVPERYFEYDFICAFDAIETLSSNNNSILKIKDFHSKFNDWMFGCLSYDLKDEIFDIPSKSNDNLHSDHISFFIPKYVILAKDSKIEILTNFCAVLVSVCNGIERQVPHVPPRFPHFDIDRQIDAFNAQQHPGIL